MSVKTSSHLAALQADLTDYRGYLAAERGVAKNTVLAYERDLCKFRDWVAHKNPKRPPPAKIDPRTAYTLLTAIIDDIRKAR